MNLLTSPSLSESNSDTVVLAPVGLGDVSTHPRLDGGFVMRQWPSLPERFWGKVDKSGECWVWTGARSADGYGAIRTGVGGLTRAQAHRISWELHYGPIPDGMWVLHHCDNPRCVRPKHLFLGTNQDNILDMVAKGRSTKGERNAKAKLTDILVSEIRRRYESEGVTQKALASEYKITKGTMNDIVHYRSWKP